MIQILIILLYAIVMALINVDDIRQSKVPEHWINALLISAIAGFSSYRDQIRPIYFSFPVLLYTYSYIFDILINWGLGRKIQAIGQTAVTDKLQRWILGNDEDKFGMWFTMKSIAFIGLVGCYLFNY